MTTFLPTLYQTSISWSEAVSRGFVRLMLEIVFGIFWACVSWGVFWMILLPLRRFHAAGFTDTKKAVLAVGLIALAEFLLFGWPLSCLSWSLYAHPFHLDENEGNISRLSEQIQDSGILIAFPLSCLISGILAMPSLRGYFAHSLDRRLG